MGWCGRPRRSRRRSDRRPRAPPCTSWSCPGRCQSSYPFVSLLREALLRNLSRRMADLFGTVHRVRLAAGSRRPRKVFASAVADSGAMTTPQRLLTLLAAALIGMAFGTTAADAASKLPRKQKFEVTFEGNWGVLWYVRMNDGEPHHNCLTGISSDGESNFDAWTKRKRKVTTKLYVDKKKGSAFGGIPIQAALERKFTFGQVPKGCEQEYARAQA